MQEPFSSGSVQLPADKPKARQSLGPAAVRVISGYENDVMDFLTDVRWIYTGAQLTPEMTQNRKQLHSRREEFLAAAIP